MMVRRNVWYAWALGGVLLSSPGAASGKCVQHREVRRYELVGLSLDDGTMVSQADTETWTDADIQISALDDGVEVIVLSADDEREVFHAELEPE